MRPRVCHGRWLCRSGMTLGVLVCFCNTGAATEVLGITINLDGILISSLCTQVCFLF